jgi:hypothetical protein
VILACHPRENGDPGSFLSLFLVTAQVRSKSPHAKPQSTQRKTQALLYLLGVLAPLCNKLLKFPDFYFPGCVITRFCHTRM